MKRPGSYWHFAETCKIEQGRMQANEVNCKRVRTGSEALPKKKKKYSLHGIINLCKCLLQQIPVSQVLE